MSFMKNSMNIIVRRVAAWKFYNFLRCAGLLQLCCAKFRNDARIDRHCERLSLRDCVAVEAKPRGNPVQHGKYLQYS